MVDAPSPQGLFPNALTEFQESKQALFPSLNQEGHTSRYCLPLIYACEQRDVIVPLDVVPHTYLNINKPSNQEPVFMSDINLLISLISTMTFIKFYQALFLKILFLLQGHMILWTPCCQFIINLVA